MSGKALVDLRTFLFRHEHLFIQAGLSCTIAACNGGIRCSHSELGKLLDQIEQKLKYLPKMIEVCKNLTKQTIAYRNNVKCSDPWSWQEGKLSNALEDCLGLLAQAERVE